MACSSCGRAGAIRSTGLVVKYSAQMPIRIRASSTEPLRPANDADKRR